ncbi:uncharacterized protein [Littorina saxatilis]|uniref:E3 ubiquitin-protein ligase APD1-4 middle domain-containing protein n=1 Tax=Littorina saxatilis TaxID=31220 RepID=A0AAN9AVB7_9CAEN
MSIFKVSRRARTWLNNRTSGRRNGACVAATITSVLVVIAIFGFTAYNLHENRFSRNQFQVHVGDEVAVSRFSDDLSEKFCSGYEVELWDRAEVYLLPHRAQTNESYHRKDAFQISYDPGMLFMNTLGFYLLENSSVKVTGCHRPEDPSDIPGEMILHRGDLHSHNGGHHDDQDDEVKRVEIPRSATCNSSHSSLPKLDYTVTEEGNYYVILTEKSCHSRRERHSDGGLRLNGTLERTAYDVSSFKDSCKNHYVCRFSLDFDDDTDDDVVIRIQNNPVTPMSKSSFNTHCHPRVMFWTGIFGGVPLVLVAFLIAFWVWLFCVKMPARELRQCQCRHTRRANSVASVAESAGGSRFNEEARLFDCVSPVAVTYKSVQDS